MQPALFARPCSRALSFAIVFLSCFALHSQTQTARIGDRLRSLNRQLSETSLRAPDAERLLTERTGSLYALIDSDPAAALSLALPERTAAMLRAILPGRVDLLESIGEWQGAASAVVEDDYERHVSRTRWQFRIPEGRARLYFVGPPPALPCERTVKVKGLRLRDRIVAERATLVAAAAEAA